MSDHRPTRDILQQVRAGFIAQGSTLTDWCRAQNIDPARAWRVLQGKQAGPKAVELRNRIRTAAIRIRRGESHSWLGQMPSIKEWTSGGDDI